jgi:hypothetical protein
MQKSSKQPIAIEKSTVLCLRGPGRVTMAEYLEGPRSVPDLVKQGSTLPSVS